MVSISSVHLLKKELNTQSLSEQIYKHSKDVRTKDEHKKKILTENQIKEEKTRFQIVKERRQAMQQSDRKKMLLRKEKTGIAELKQKKLDRQKSHNVVSTKNQKTSFKSNLEKLHRTDKNKQMETELRNQVRKNLYKKHRLSKTIAKTLGL